MSWLVLGFNLKAYSLYLFASKKKINDQGEFRCFAVGNAPVSRVGFVRLLESCEGGRFWAGRGLAMPACFVSFCLTVNDFTSRTPTAITAPMMR